MTRKLMATVAELSVYQEQSMRLAQQVEDSTLELEAAKSRSEQGLPPTLEVC